MSDGEDDMPSLYHLEEEDEEIEDDEEDEEEFQGHQEDDEEAEAEEGGGGGGDDDVHGGQGGKADDMMLEDLLETMLDEDGNLGGEQVAVERKDMPEPEERRIVSEEKVDDDIPSTRQQQKGDGEAAATMVDYLQQFDDMYDTFPRDPVDGTIRVEELTIEQRKIYNAKVMSLLTENQMDRYECFRRSSLKEPMRRLVQMVVGGGLPKNTDKIVIAMSGVAKVFVGELVEESRRIADARGNLGALSKEDVCEAYFRVSSSSKELQQSRGKRMKL